MRLDKNSSSRLLVEGPDDQHSIIQLLARHGYDWEDSALVRPYVEATGGVDALLEALAPAVKTYARLGIVLDADHSPDSQWRRVRERLIALQVAVPERLPQEGLLASRPDGPQAVGVWLMPDNRAVGKLEDFLSTLIDAGDQVWPHAQAATVAARQLGARGRFMPGSHGKPNPDSPSDLRSGRTSSEMIPRSHWLSCRGSVAYLGRDARCAAG